MNQAQALYHLQTIDLTIGNRRSRLAEVEQQLGQNERVMAAEQALQRAEESLAPWRARVHDLELESQSVSDKVAATERRLYGGAVSNPKELQDLQDETASLKRRHAKLEDALLEAMIEVENGQAACKESKQNLAAARSAWQAEQTECMAERRALHHALTELESQRQEALKAVSAESLAVYDSLRASKHGHAISELTGEMCRRCGVGQTTTLIQQVRQGRALVYCANCGRVLVLL